MTAPTCSTCRWWKKTTDDDDGLLTGMVRNAGEELEFWSWDMTPEDQAQADAIRARVGKCGSPKLHFYVLPQRGEAAVVDGSEYKAELCTDGEFGCTNHEPA